MFTGRIWLHEQEYRSMTPKAAKEYFTWFKENIPNELDFLQKMTSSSVVLDFTPESLKVLEDWFIPMRKYVELSEKQILEDYAGAPEFILQDALQTRYAPTVGTADLGARIAIYFGEVFVRNDPDLYWDYVKKPKTDVSFNVPAIFGFSPPNMKYQDSADTFKWGMPMYSDSAKGLNWKKTWYELYQIRKNLKELYWSPDYSIEKHMQYMDEWQERDKKEGKLKEGEIIIMPGSMIRLNEAITKRINK